MPTIRPISDLRNKFAEISASIHEKGHPVLLAKNGVGNMVVMSIEQYETLTLDRRITDEIDSPRGRRPHHDCSRQCRGVSAHHALPPSGSHTAAQDPARVSRTSGRRLSCG